MKTLSDSRRLAESLVEIGIASGVQTEALITNMEAPLGRTVGNSLEVIECIETLKGRGPADVADLSILLAARMLVVAGVERDEAPAVSRVRDALSSGAGVEKLKAIIRFQGGDLRVVDRYDLLPSAPDRYDVAARTDGYVSALVAEDVGRAAVLLGAGRAKLDDEIDPGVGVEIVATVGAAVRRGDPVMRVHHRNGRGLSDALPLLERSVRITDAPPEARPVVVDRVVAGARRKQ
jgi:thymidine phosphorylase